MKNPYKIPKDFVKIINEFNYKVVNYMTKDLTSPYDIGIESMSKLGKYKTNEKQSNRGFLFQHLDFIIEYCSAIELPKNKKIPKIYKPICKQFPKNKTKKDVNIVIKVKTRKYKPTLINNIDVTSKEFLFTYEWRKLRMEALILYGNVCQCCGGGAKNNKIINVDHIKPRKVYPELALDIKNLQILCEECNHGKGNWDDTDWR